MKRWAAVLIFAVALAAPARAQEVPIDQMSKAEALDFLRGLLIAGGKVVYHSDHLDTATGKTWSHDWSFETRDATVDPASCTLRYHYLSVRDGAPFAEATTSGVDFSQVDAISQEGEVSRLNDESARYGNTTWRATVTPDVWTVLVFRNGGANSFRFYSRNLADQAAQTASRLRALCRAG